MILKIAVIVLSVVAIVLTSIIIGGVIIIGQVLENDPNTRSEIRQWLGAGGGESGQNSYNPNPIEIKVGDTMTWINSDSSPHTVTSSSNDGSITFDSDVLRRGETFSFTFDKEGQYPYSCTLHPSMVGTVVVTAS